jgi:hypothetical protein
MLNIFVFAAVTLTIMGLAYEGFVLEWYGIVGTLIIVTDCAFLLSTALNLVFCRKDRVIFLFSIISLTMIIIALIMLALKIEYPVITLVLWNFYIWFYYGIRLSKRLWIRE